MSWLDVDWKRERPSDSATDWIWRTVEVQPLDSAPPIVEEYLAALRRMNVNGDAVYARFAVSGDRDFEWFTTRNRWDEIGFFARLLTHPTARRKLPELTSQAQFGADVTFEWGSSLTLDGELARALVDGGAYKKFDGTAREAKDLGARVCEALFGDRYPEVEVFRCWKAWSPWFHDVAWDSTCFVIDRRLQEVSVLASTDTD
jgi:hypothetical protein